jgi:hypothetical protein
MAVMAVVGVVTSLVVGILYADYYDYAIRAGINAIIFCYAYSAYRSRKVAA